VHGADGTISAAEEPAFRVSTTCRSRRERADPQPREAIIVRRRRELRNEGFALLVFLVPLVFCLALAGAVGLLTTNGVKASTRSRAKFIADYAADAGVQVGNAMVRAASDGHKSLAWKEAIDGQSVTVSITEVETDVYKIVGTCQVDDALSTSEMWVTLNREPISFAAQSGFEISLGKDAKITGDLRVDLDSNARVSGFNHDAEGNLLSDPSEAVPGLGVHSTGEGTDWNVTTRSTSDVSGSPSDTANDLDDHAGALESVIAHARSNFDVSASGETLLQDPAIGYWGKKSAPVIAYVSLGESKTLTLPPA
jgi:hypothetical protein